MSALKTIALVAASIGSLGIFSTGLQAQISDNQIKGWASDSSASDIGYGLKKLFGDASSSRPAQFTQMLQKAKASAASGVLHKPFEKGLQDVQGMYKAKGYDFEFQNSQANFYNQMSLLSGMAIMEGPAGSDSFDLDDVSLKTLEGRSKEALKIKVVDAADINAHYSEDGLAAKPASEQFAHPFKFDRSTPEALAKSVATANDFLKFQGASEEVAHVDENGRLHLNGAPISVYKSLLPKITADRITAFEKQASSVFEEDVSDRASTSGDHSILNKVVYNSSFAIVPASSHHVVIQMKDGSFDVVEHPSQLSDAQINNAKAMYMSNEAINDFVARTQGKEAPPMSDEQLFQFYNHVIKMTGASARISSAEDQVEHMLLDLGLPECKDA